MSNTPENLRYTKSHEWVNLEDDGSVTIGITDHAQELLGDLVFVELPEVDADLVGGDECAVVESVKAASDVYAPLGGCVTAINESLEDSPQNINEDAFGEGWLFKMMPTSAADLDEMMDAEAYDAHVASEDH